MAERAICDNKVWAQVVDLADMSCFEAEVLDLTDTGCWISSEQVDLLKEEIGLLFPGQVHLIPSKVIAFGDNTAQVVFGAQPEVKERRREVRRPVWITAIVCSPESAAAFQCRIVDASVSGCRLESKKLAKLPSAVEIAIPGLSLPIAGKIVWRSNDQAGVQLKWPFKVDKEPANEVAGILEAYDAEKEKSSKKKKRISAFGR